MYIFTETASFVWAFLHFLLRAADRTAAQNSPGRRTRQSTVRYDEFFFHNFLKINKNGLTSPKFSIIINFESERKGKRFLYE